MTASGMTLPTSTFGSFDLLKILSSHPRPSHSTATADGGIWAWSTSRASKKATAPDPERFGLWLDRRRPDCPADPFEDEPQYPGVAVGARGKNLPVGSYYGYATGIVGLRLFPNPDFDAAAEGRWDAERFYDDPEVLPRRIWCGPYRVGMSCGVLPCRPQPGATARGSRAARVGEPQLQVGAQYFWVDRIFFWSSDRGEFRLPAVPYLASGLARYLARLHRQHQQPAHDERRLQLSARGSGGAQALGLGESRRRRAEQQAIQRLRSRRCRSSSRRRHTVWTPHVLKDGADSVGALARSTASTSTSACSARSGCGTSIRWWAASRSRRSRSRTLRRIPATGTRPRSRRRTWRCSFSRPPSRTCCKDAPGGDGTWPTDKPQLTRGKVVFAENCARCHSSKLPAPAEADVGWLRRSRLPGLLEPLLGVDEDGRLQEADAADRPGGRFPRRQLSVHRHARPCHAAADECLQPIGDECARAATSGTTSLRSPTSICRRSARHRLQPGHRRASALRMPAGGRGYTRRPSLVSLWSTAPFLLNNSVGPFNPDPSVPARLASFQKSIEPDCCGRSAGRMDPVFGSRIPGVIDRTTMPSYLRVPAGYLADLCGAPKTSSALSSPRCSMTAGWRSAPFPRECRWGCCPI